jgi:hypothetical protein
MVAGTATTEDLSEVEATRLWNAMVKGGHNLFPKIFPEFFSSVTFLQGDGGVGTIKQLNFTPGITAINSTLINIILPLLVVSSIESDQYQMQMVTSVLIMFFIFMSQLIRISSTPRSESMKWTRGRWCSSIQQ